MVLGLVASVVLAQGSLLHAIGMIVLGLLLGLVGTDVKSGTQRFTFEIPQLADGIGFVVVAMGMFGLSEIIRNLDHEEAGRSAVTRITTLMPTREDWRRMVAPILRGTAIGSALGILPGSGSILGAFAAYSIEKKVSRNRAEFGKGAIEGVAAPEAANNAGAQTSFIPMLTLGIPSNPVMALMIGAMIIQGIQPGPSVMTEQPALFWGMIVSMWIGNLFLVILNLPMIGLWVRLIMVPYHLLYPSILVFCAIGVFSLNNSEFDVYLMALFGVLGYVFARLECEPAPMLLAFILGPADGGVPAAGHAALARESLGPRPAPHQRDAAGAGRAGAGRRPAPGVRPDTEGSLLAEEVCRGRVPSLPGSRGRSRRSTDGRPGPPRSGRSQAVRSGRSRPGHIPRHRWWRSRAAPALASRPAPPPDPRHEPAQPEHPVPVGVDHVHDELDLRRRPEGGCRARRTLAGSRWPARSAILRRRHRRRTRRRGGRGQGEAARAWGEFSWIRVRSGVCRHCVPVHTRVTRTSLRRKEERPRRARFPRM